MQINAGTFLVATTIPSTEDTPQYYSYSLTFVLTSLTLGAGYGPRSYSPPSRTVRQVQL